LRKFLAVAVSAGKKDSMANSDKVISTGVPNTVVVLMKERMPRSVTSRKGTNMILEALKQAANT
jgi:hypothetical protein